MKLAGTGTNATHWSALTGGTSTTGGLFTSATGTIVNGSGARRYVDSGVALDITINGLLRQVEPLSASVESKVPDDADFAAANDLDEPYYDSSLDRIVFAAATPVKLDGEGFRAANSAAANSAAIALAIDRTIEAGGLDPATNTRIPNRPLEVGYGTFKLNEPLLDWEGEALRSVMGFELRTAGEKATIFSADVSMDSVMRLNGFAHTHLGGFTLKTKSEGTDASVVVQTAFHLFWDNTVASPTKASRSTTQNRFESIDIANCRFALAGAQFGRDGDNNQVDGDITNKIHVHSAWIGKLVTGVAATDVFTSVAHGYVDATTIIFTDLAGGAGITLGMEYHVINATADTFKLSETSGGASINFTTDVTTAWTGPSALYRVGVKYGSGVPSNNLLHHADFITVNQCRRGIHMAATQFSADMAMLQGNDVDIYFEGIQSFFSIGSGRSENSGRFIATSGGTEVPAQISIHDYHIDLAKLRSNGRWIEINAPGAIALERVKTINPPAGITPKIRCSPPGSAFHKMQISLDGCVLQQAASTVFDIDAARVQTVTDGLVETDATAGAVAARPGRWTDGNFGARTRADRKRALQLPTGLLDETYERDRVVAGTTSATGVLQLMGHVLLVEGEPITNLLSRTSTTLATTPTNQWMALIRAVAGGAVLCKTEDKLTEAWAASTDKSFAITGGPYIPTTTELAWLCLMVKATGSPTIGGTATGNSGFNGKVPIKCGTADTGLTDPASLGATVGTITATGVMLWGGMN